MEKLGFYSFMSLWWTIPETKHFPVQTFCFFNVYVSEQASPLPSFFPELAKEQGYKPHFIESKRAWTNLTQIDMSKLWGDPRLGKSGISICPDLCRYLNNSTEPWNLKTEIIIKSAQLLPSV